MTREEYEAKVQSMPKELQDQFRGSLEISLSKRIVNRFMSTVMQAYAWGQRGAQKTGDADGYMHGAVDMLEAIRTVSDMDAVNIHKYFGIDHQSSLEGLYWVVQTSAGDILETVDKYRDDKMQEKDEREKVAVQAMADTIGITSRWWATGTASAFQIRGGASRRSHRGPSRGA